MESERGFEQVRFSYDEGRGAEADWGSSQEEYEKYGCAAFRTCLMAPFCTKDEKRKVLTVSVYRQTIEQQKERQV